MCMCLALARGPLAVLAADTATFLPADDGERLEIVDTTDRRLLSVDGGWVSGTGNALALRIALDALADCGVRNLERARDTVRRAYERTKDRTPGVVASVGGKDQLPMIFVVREGGEEATAHSFFVDGTPGVQGVEADGSPVDNTLLHYTYPDALTFEETQERTLEAYHAETFAGMVQRVGLFFQAAQDAGKAGPVLNVATLYRNESGVWEKMYLDAPLPLVWGSHPDALLRAFGPPPSDAVPLGRWIDRRASEIIRQAAPRDLASTAA